MTRNPGQERRINFETGETPKASEWARTIDHTLLKPDASAEDIKRLCGEAALYQFASVCVNPVWVRVASDHLKNTRVAVCAAIGFPLGASLPEIKIHETCRAIEDGASEVDMVINIGALKSGQDSGVESEIRSLVGIAHKASAICKVIIEACLLTDGEKVRACLAARRAGADFVKTSTGFSTGGATEADVALMRETVGPGIGVKAAGGIKGLEDARRMIAAGATRIGTSAGVEIMQQAGSGSTGAS